MAFAEPARWYVISLRPQGEHAPLRRAAARHGARLLALSPWRLQLRGDDATLAGLRDALAGPVVLFTSPVAVRAARALMRLERKSGQAWIAVGAGTARALRRAGISEVFSPARMDSEGLLELPQLRGPIHGEVGLVTAPEGRDVLASALRERGARVLRADVYVRVPVPLAPASLRRMRALDAPACIALSSGAALQQVIASAPADILELLRSLPVAAASARLAMLAADAGFAQVDLADGPRPRQLLAVIARRFR